MFSLSNPCNMMIQPFYHISIHYNELKITWNWNHYTCFLKAENQWTYDNSIQHNTILICLFLPFLWPVCSLVCLFFSAFSLGLLEVQEKRINRDMLNSRETSQVLISMFRLWALVAVPMAHLPTFFHGQSPVSAWTIVLYHVFVFLQAI